MRVHVLIIDMPCSAPAELTRRAQEMLSFLCQPLCMLSSSMPAVHVESCQRTMRRQDFFGDGVTNERTMDCAKRNSKERFVVECVGIRLRVPPPGYGWQGDAGQI